MLEPLRWVLEAYRAESAFLGSAYRWLAFEQVPAVLPVWEAMAEVFRPLGYSVVTGILNAEQYGVPQTRRRAILIASLDREVSLPTPTHSRYYSRDPKRLDSGVLPWVSMAEALGWTESAVVGFPRLADGGEKISIDGVEYRARDLRPDDVPAQVVTEKARSWKRFVSSAQRNATVREESEPAPTITGGRDFGERRWMLTRQTGATARDQDHPSPTILAEGLAKSVQVWTDQPGPYVPAWTNDRPSTSVAGDPRIGQPGHKCMTDDCHPGRGKTRQFDRGSVRVTQDEAATLQTFPAGHPWQGAKSKQFQQIGNAIPPLLAGAVLRSAAGLAEVDSRE